jgi:hypothetical protein
VVTEDHRGVVLYLIFQQVLSLVLLMGRTASSKDVELLLVLRHEVAVLRRTKPTPRLDWADRSVFAAPHPAAAHGLARRSPVHPRHDLHWHCRLVRRRWPYPNRAGCPLIDAVVAALVERMARENPTWG